MDGFVSFLGRLGSSVFSLFEKVSFTVAGISFTWLDVFIWSFGFVFLCWLLKHLLEL